MKKSKEKKIIKPKIDKLYLRIMITHQNNHIQYNTMSKQSQYKYFIKHIYNHH